MNKPLLNRLSFLLLMCMYGCMGPLIRGIDMPSSVIAWLRAWISVLFLLLFLWLSGRRFTRQEIRAQVRPMFFSGLLLAVDWVGLFAAYSYTTVATTTLCYYMASIFVPIGAAVLLRERVSLRSALCIAAAFAGMVFVSGVAENGLPALSELLGVLLALVGALGYAGVVLINKRHPAGNPFLRTTIQLLSAAFWITPYVLLTEDMAAVHVTAKSVLLLLLLGIGVTGIAYVAYFTLIVRIPSQTVALISYADPVVAVLISVFFLGESMTAGGVLGAVLIIGAAVISELPSRKKQSSAGGSERY